MSGKFSMDDYVDVAERIALFREKHPEGSLRSEILRYPTETFPFVVMQAKAYRHPTDPTPGIGHAAEPFPGRTPYTKDSEVMVAETSAWGRAIVASLAADTKRGVASAQEVRNSSQAPAAKPATKAPEAPPVAPESTTPAPSSTEGTEPEGDASHEATPTPSGAGVDMDGPAAQAQWTRAVELGLTQGVVLKRVRMLYPNVRTASEITVGQLQEILTGAES